MLLGQKLQHTRISFRTMISSWLFAVLVLGATYKGNLVAYLSTSTYTMPVTTLEELSHKKDLTVLHNPNGAMKEWLEVS